MWSFSPGDVYKRQFYDYESLGMFNLFLTPVYDTESARQFRASMNKEFGIDVYKRQPMVCVKGIVCFI